MDRVLCTLLSGAFGAMAWATGAQAVVVTPTGDTGGNLDQPIYSVSGLHQGDVFDLTWGGPAGVSAHGTLSIDALFATENRADPGFFAGIRVSITNTSAPNNVTLGALGPSITTFGLSIDDFLGFASLDPPVRTGGSKLTRAAPGSVPGFEKHNDVCAYAGIECSVGGVDTGVLPVDADYGKQLGNDVFDFKVELASMDAIVNGLTLDAFAIKIQRGPRVPGNLYPSYELAGIPSLRLADERATIASLRTVPEPATLGLLGLGLAGLGALARRRRAD